MSYQLKNDKPIQSPEEDSLGRDRFARDLANIITNYSKKQKNRDGLVIGLEGEWGSGKTSLLNLLKIHLPKDFIMVQNFNSWLAMDKKILIEEFFRIIVNSYRINSKIRNVLEDYIKPFLDAFSLKFPMGIVNVNAGQLVKNLSKNNKSSTEQKMKIDDELRKKKGKWLVVLVDDIDRLSYQEISILFQLIKNIADFPGIVYVLAYDRSVVVNALEQVQQGKGVDYLQKVVQVTYDVPAPYIEQLNEYLFHLIPIKDELFHNEAEYIHFQMIYFPHLQYFLKNIRDCNRLANAFTLKYCLCGGDCNFTDLLALTFVEVFEPRAYELIRKYKMYMVARHSTGIEFNDTEKVGLKDFYTRLKDSFSPEHQKDVDGLMQHLFTRFYNLATDKNEVGELNRVFGIDDPTAFDRYFTLSVKDDEISIEEVSYFLETKKDINDIETQLSDWNEKGKLGYFLQQGSRILRETSKYAAYFDNEKIKNYLEAFSRLKIKNTSDDSKPNPGIFLSIFIDRLTLIAIYQHISSEGKERFLGDLVNDKDINCSIIGCVLNSISKKVQNGDASELLNKDALSEFYNTFLQKIKKISQENEFFQEIYIRDLLSFWKRKELDTYRNFLQGYHNEPLKLAYRIQVCIRPFTINDNYIVAKELIEDFPIVQDMPIMSALLSSELIKMLPEEVQERIAALYLLWEKSNHQIDEMKESIISVAEVRQYIASL